METRTFLEENASGQVGASGWCLKVLFLRSTSALCTESSLHRGKLAAF